MSRPPIAELQAIPYETKLLWVYQKTAEALEYCDLHSIEPWVSYSGGKDSEVLLDVVRSIRPSVKAVFVNTGLEYPEVVAHARRARGLVEIRPKTSFKTVLERHGYPVVSKKVAMNVSRIRNTKSLEQINLRMHGGINPTSGKVQHQSLPDKWKFLLAAPFKISDECCRIMKKRPLGQLGGMPFIGTLAADSESRRLAWQRDGCNVYDAAKGSSRPLSIWTEQDVLRYVVENGLSIAPVYGRVERGDDGLLHCTGEDRTGCVFCLFGIFREQKKRGCNRFQRMYTTHPELWTYCMDKLGIRQVMEFLGLPVLPSQKSVAICDSSV